MLQDTRKAWATVLLAGTALTSSHAHALTPLDCLHHQAEPGDTLIGLMQRHLLPSARWQELAQINRIVNPRRIPVGTRLCLPTRLLRGQAVAARVLSVQGEAQLAPAGQTARPLQAGDAVTEQGQILTGAQGQASIELADGSVLQVHPHSQVQLQQTQAHESVGLLRATWQVLRGRVTSWVRPNQPEPKPRHQVRTPQAVLAVRGTEFRVQVAERLTRAETLSGKVAISAASSAQPLPAQLLTAREGLLIGTRGSALSSRALPLLPAPHIDAARQHFERPLVKLDAQAVPGAKGYHFQVAHDAQFRQIVHEQSTQEPSLRTAALPDGELHWRVRARDANGLEGLDAAGQLHLNAHPEPPIPTAPGADGRLRSGTLTLSWAQPPQASAYRLQIASSASFSGPLLLDETTPEPHWSRTWPPGRYHWRLATVQRGPDGTPDTGPWGDARLIDLRAAPAALPAPDLSQEALFFQPMLEPGQTVRLQVARDSGFAHLLLDESHRELPIRMARPQAGGRLHVRYQATDADGFVGPMSAVQTVDLPRCVETGHGDCVTSAAGALTTQ